MKKTIIIKTCIIAIMMISYVKNTHAQQNIQSCLDIHTSEKDVRKVERQGDDYFRTYNLTNLTKGLANFYSNFKYTDNIEGHSATDLDSSIERISVDDICRFYSDIVATKKYDPKVDLAAVRITYGMKGKRLMMIYEPIVLKPKKIRNRRNWYECSLDLSTKNFYWVATDGKLQQFANLDDTAAFINAYRNSDSHFYFERQLESGNHKFQYDNDARSTVFLMQDIISVYRQNPNPPDPARMITFSFVSDVFGPPNRYKVHIVAYYNIEQNSTANGRFVNYGADYSQMCPPQCSSITLKIAR